MLVAAASALLAAVAFLLWPSPTESLRFHLNDLWTGQPLTTGTLRIEESRFTFQLNGLIPQRVRIITINGSTAEITGLPKEDQSTSISVSVPGYEKALLLPHATRTGRNSKYYMILHNLSRGRSLRESPYEYVRKDKTFALALEPLQGNPSDNESIEIMPPAGSRENAIAAVQQYMLSHGAKYSTFPNDTR